MNSPPLPASLRFLVAREESWSKPHPRAEGEKDFAGAFRKGLNVSCRRLVSAREL